MASFPGCSGNHEFLDDWTIVSKICIMCTFAASVQRNLYDKRAKKQLAGDTVSSTILNVCITFWKNFWRNPSLDETGHKALILSRQLKKYIAEDPETKHQITLPLIVFLHIWRSASKEVQATAQLIVAALFFGLWPCEYTEVTGLRKTKKIGSTADPLLPQQKGNPQIKQMIAPPEVFFVGNHHIH